MNDDERSQIDNWMEKLAGALDLIGLPLEIDDILNLAGTAARTVVRPAAPLTTFIVGYAAGHAAATGVDPHQAMKVAIATAESLGATGSTVGE